MLAAVLEVGLCTRAEEEACNDTEVEDIADGDDDDNDEDDVDLGVLGFRSNPNEYEWLFAA
jgi:hypothetical protein